MKILMAKFIKRVNSERGDGIAVVAFGIFILMVMIFIALNTLNSRLVEQGYNNLRDAVMSASSGSVIHLLLNVDETNPDNNQIGLQQPGTTLQYDPYLQLALGYIINYNASGSAGVANKEISVEQNNFIKLDHKKVVNSTLKLIDDVVLNGQGNIYGNFDRYQIFMFFIEPNYDNDYLKSFNLIYYTNEDMVPTEHGVILPVSGSSMKEMYMNLEGTISTKVSEISGKTYKINLNADAAVSDEDLIRRMETKPYYLIVVSDFALPTIFTGATGETLTTQDNGIIKSLFGTDGSLAQPMCALQSGKIERKIAKD